MRSTPGSLDLEVAFFEFFDQYVAVVALDFDHTVLHRTPATAAMLQLLRESLEFSFWERDAGERGHGLALAPLRFPPHSNNAVAEVRWGVALAGILAAHTTLAWQATVLAHATVLRGVH